MVMTNWPSILNCIAPSLNIRTGFESMLVKTKRICLMDSHQASPRLFSPPMKA